MKKHLLPFAAACLTILIPNVASGVTIIGGLLGGDLTDPENDGVEGDTVPEAGGTPQTAGTNFNWISISASSEEYFGNFGGSEGSFDIFDNITGGGQAKYCCGGAPWNVTVQFSDSYTLTHFTLTSSNDTPARDPDIWQILGSNDGATWTNIFSYDENDPTANGGIPPNHAGNPWTARDQTLLFEGDGDDFATPGAYSWFRFNADSAVGSGAGGGNLALSELELFGTPIPEPSGTSLIALAGLALGLRRRR